MNQIKEPEGEVEHLVRLLREAGQKDWGWSKVERIERSKGEDWSG